MENNKKYFLMLFLNIFLFLIALLMAFLIRFKLNNKNPLNRNFLKTELTNRFNNLSLYVDGRYFRKVQNNEIVILQGVSTMKFARYGEFYDEKEFENFLRLLKKAIKEFKLNSLLIYVNEERLINSQRFLDDLIAFCLNNSIYAYLVPTQNTDEYATKHFENAPFFIATLAKRYKKYSNVLYGIWAEPNFGNFHSWEIYFEKGINLIRKVNPNAVIGVAGDFYGRKFPTNSRLYDYQNIFLDFHDYPAKDADELLNLKIKSFLWDSFYKNHTIIVSEFGGVWFKDFGSQPDVKYIEKVLLDVKERKLNFFMYKIDPYSDMSLVKNYDKFELTERGKVFFKHRKN